MTSQYRWPVVLGDRVALAPHLDLWMAGVRFGQVTAVSDTPMFGARRYRLKVAGQRMRVWVFADSLLGAVGAMPSTDNPDSIGAGWPEEAQS